jgi:N-acetylglucosaminyldiphosphoundecaprenol N-acetyl-beta-D-mannosaminyltransferase
MTAMRVLHVSRYFHPAVGGTENVIAGLAAALTAHDIESQVLTTTRRSDERGPAPRVPVVRVPVVGPDRFPIPAGRLRHVLRSFADADVVHVHDVRFLFEVAQLLTRVLGRPLVVSTHGLLFHTPEYGRTKQVLWRHYYGRALRRADRVVAASERDAELCRSVGVRENLSVIHNGVDTEPLLAIPPDAPRVPGRLFAFGRIAVEKGLDRLAGILEASPPSWRLRIAGTGDPEVIERLTADLAPFGDRVELLGYLDGHELVDELARCACVLLPSPEEAFGLTLVEAMASGAPVVASDIPAYREVADGADVELVDFASPPDVVAAVERATSRRVELDRRRARARSFSWPDTARRFADVYREVAPSATRARGSGWERVLGVEVEALDRTELLRAIETSVEARDPAAARPLVIANHNLHSAALSRRDPGLRRFYSRADRVFVDGMPLAWFGRLTGGALRRQHRTTYVDLIHPLADLAVASGWRVMFVAGTDEAVERGRAALLERHPGLCLTVRSGWFDARQGGPEDEMVLAEIASVEPHVLLVGMGMPRQEHWIDGRRDRIHASVVMNAGACLDYVAGIQRTPPRWMGALGLEWLARLVGDPRRMARRYLVEPWSLVPIAARELVAATVRRLGRSA